MPPASSSSGDPRPLVTEALIVGAAETPYRRRLPEGVTTLSLLAAAGAEALADAGVEPQDVDGLALSSLTAAPDHAIDVAWRLGLRIRWLMDDVSGGASAINALQHARRAVESGDASVILLLAGDAFRPGDFARLVDAFNSATRDQVAPLATGGPNALFALVTRRHMDRHQLDRTVYGKVAIAQREWAVRNPAALYREPLSMRDYLSAPLVADPLGRYDCVPVVSGANALVVASSERVARRPAAGVRAIVARHNADQQRGDGLRTGLSEAAPALWADAGRTPEDVDVVEVYDDYPVMVLVQLADLGFLADDVERFVDDRLATHTLPVNTSGGQLSAGQAGAAGGMHLLVEAVRQLRHEAGARQVANARTALVTGYGMVVYRHGGCANAVVLERAE